ncbi:hypothetical protein [Nocardia sp. NPDC048505]|uniref:hypothetical protein n=1 Tax=unclassified Nocardia TaxID=2637762 RepID=UPI0033F0694E
MQELRDAADRFAIMEVPAAELPMIAAHALARGADSPALRELAGLGRAEDGGIGLFRTALLELGVLGSAAADWPGDRPTMLLRRVRHYAERLASGASETGDPVAAALIDLANLGPEWDARFGRQAHDFEILTVLWHDLPQDRESLGRDLQVAAAALLDGLDSVPGEASGVVRRR